MDYEITEIDITYLNELQIEALMCDDIHKLKGITQEIIKYNYRLAKKMNEIISSLSKV